MFSNSLVKEILDKTFHHFNVQGGSYIQPNKEGNATL